MRRIKTSVALCLTQVNAFSLDKLSTMLGNPVHLFIKLLMPRQIKNKITLPSFGQQSMQLFSSHANLKIAAVK
jgi:hypothetical protein